MSDIKNILQRAPIEDGSTTTFGPDIIIQLRAIVERHEKLEAAAEQVIRTVLDAYPLMIPLDLVGPLHRALRTDEPK
jgi:hypothetical protein